MMNREAADTANAEDGPASALKPVLDADTEDEARRIVEDIASALLTARPKTLALGSGLSGQLLFYSYHAHAFGASSTRDRADEACAALVAGLNLPLPATLHGGFAGLGWTLAHLTAGDDAMEAVLTQVDQRVLDALAVARWRASYDLISGLTGLGVYGLERFPRRSGRAIVERVLHHLERLVTPRDVGHSWFTPPGLIVQWQREHAPTGYYNFGLSHGVPGIIAMLATCISEGAAEDHAHALLEPAMAWLLSRQLPPGSPGRFPTWEVEQGSQFGSRLAWCYGDPGTAVAMHAAAAATGRTDWREAALDVAHWAARPGTNGGVIDASICHGAYGLTHIFHRLYRATGSPLLGQAARRWLGRALDMHEPGRGLGGYQFYHPKERLRPGQTPEDYVEAWVDEPGLLMGSAGVGLTLLSLLASDSPSWDLPLLTALDPIG